MAADRDRSRVRHCQRLVHPMQRSAEQSLPVPTNAIVPAVPLPRVLLARFHPLADDTQIVVVGRVVCAPEGAHLDAASQGGLFAVPATLLLKLRYLIERAAPDPFERLRKLRSRFWSFVEITPSEKEPDA